MLKKGKVSYISSQNVYVKFESTEGINIGDTLFLNRKGQMIPSLVVDNKSSISCVCTPISSVEISISDEIFTQKVEIEKIQVEKLLLLQENRATPETHQPHEIEDPDPPIQMAKELPKPIFKQRINGRVSIASYNIISGSRTNHRMRYTFAMRGDNLGNSRLSMDSYITFRHTLNEWEEVKNNINNALKVYSLALKYDFNKTTSLTLGRKINPKISSMGSIDGLQFEKGFGNFLFGVLLGSRPDYFDYSLNLNLFQYGAYFTHESNTNNKFLHSTIAFIEQRNNSKIDRRFIYFQHTNSIFKNLNLFSSVEISLYENINEEPKNVLDLTNLYVSLRYRFSKKLNFSASYDNRKNIHYFETFKTFIDSLIEKESRQGVRLSANYRLFKNITWGINTGWRFQKSEKNLSKNLNSYLTFSRVPLLNIRTTITANFLKTNYLESRIFGIRISKEIVSNKLDGNINFRMVDYKYLNYESATHQNVMGINLSMRIIKKLTLYVNYEGTFDSQNIVYNRFYTKIIQRF